MKRAATIQAADPQPASDLLDGSRLLEDRKYALLWFKPYKSA
jgi:hypothetical protein